MAQKNGRVYITTVSLFDAKTSRTTYAVVRKRRAVATLPDDVVVRDYKHARNSTIGYTRDGTDGEMIYAEPVYVGHLFVIPTSLEHV